MKHKKIFIPWFYTNSPCQIVQTLVLCSSALWTITVVSVSMCCLMACSYLNFRARRTLTAKQTNRRVLSTCLSSLGPIPGALGSARPAVSGLKGFVLFCCQDDQWLVCDAGKRWPGPHSRRERGEIMKKGLGSEPAGESCSLHLLPSVAGPDGRSGVTWTSPRRNPGLVSQPCDDTAWACVTSHQGKL